MLSDILETGFDVFRYRSHPNFDLWVRVHHLLITRSPGSVKVEKVKSHQDDIHLLGHAAQWKARGNDAVDALAKRTLQEFNTFRLAQRPEWQTAHENRRLDQAYLATQFLHELSLLLFKTRNSGNVDDQERIVPEAELLGNPPADSFQLFPVGIPVSFPGKKWDGRWLTLVCHYFAQLQWTSSPAPLAGEISCLEVLVDLLISYQVHTPLNKKNLKRKHGHISHLDWEHISVVNYLPSPGEAALLPPPLLTECHATWLNTIDYLKPLVNLLPVERTTRRSLAHLGYSNMLPTWPSRPVLLAGNSASRFLASIISPGARKLKYRCVFPRRPGRPLPPCFGEDLNR